MGGGYFFRLVVFRASGVRIAVGWGWGGVSGLPRACGCLVCNWLKAWLPACFWQDQWLSHYYYLSFLTRTHVFILSAYLKTIVVCLNRCRVTPEWRAEGLAFIQFTLTFISAEQSWKFLVCWALLEWGLCFSHRAGDDLPWLYARLVLPLPTAGSRTLAHKDKQCGLSCSVAVTAGMKSFWHGAQKWLFAKEFVRVGVHRLLGDAFPPPLVMGGREAETLCIWNLSPGSSVPIKPFRFGNSLWLQIKTAT